MRIRHDGYDDWRLVEGEDPSDVPLEAWMKFNKEFRKRRQRGLFAPLDEMKAHQIMCGELVNASEHMRLHALRAAGVTFLCALPTGWLMWPLMVVDIVYFQREVFLFSQEVYMMYQPRRACRRFRFDYVNVTVLVAKLLEPIAVRQMKTGLGIAGRTAVKRGVKMFRAPIQVFLR